MSDPERPPSTPADHQAPTDTDPAAPRRPGRRGILRALWLLPLLVIVALVGAVGLLFSATGSRWLLDRVPGLSVTGPQGALARDFQAQALRYTLGPGRTLVLDTPEWTGWHLSWGEIRLDRLQARKITIEGAPPPPSDTPTRLPTQLIVPWVVRLDDVRVDEVALPALGEHPLRDLRARLHLAAGAAGQHTVELQRLRWDRWAVQGQARLQANAPLTLNATLQAGPDAVPPLPSSSPSSQAPVLPLPADSRLNLTLDGPLSRLQVATTLQTSGQSLTARAEVRPEAPLPVSQLDARFEALDLSALRSDWPASALTGRIQAHLPGPDGSATASPLTIDARVSNAAAGAWDLGRLPFHRVQLKTLSRVDEPRRGALESLEVALGTPEAPAGTVRGSGTWSALTGAPTDARLELALDQVEPARLSTSAPPLRLSGPIQVRYRTTAPAPAAASPHPVAVARPFLPSGAHVDAELALTGRTTAALPHGPGAGTPVSLQLRGTVDERSATLTSMSARAAEAQALGRLELRQTPTRDQTLWSATGQIDLQRFDPSVWWPAAGRTGTSRINARLDVDLRTPHAALSDPDPLARWRQVLGQARLALRPSQVLGVNTEGHLQLSRRQTAAPFLADVNLSAADTRVEGEVRLDPTTQVQQTQLKVRSPALERLQAWWRLVLPDLAPAGDLEASLQAAGRWPDWTTQGRLGSRRLSLGTRGQVQGLAGQWSLAAQPSAPFDLTLTAEQGRWDTTQLRRWTLRGTGQARQHEIRLDAQAVLGGTDPTRAPTARPLDAALKIAGGLTRDRQSLAWAGTVQQMEVRDPTPGHEMWNLRLGTPTSVRFEQSQTGSRTRTQATVGALRLEVAQARVLTEPLLWTSDGTQRQLRFKARMEPLPVAPLLAQLQPDFGWSGDLHLSGLVEVDASATGLRARASVQRDRGDLMVRDAQSGRPAQVLGLDTLKLALDAQDGRWRMTQQISGRDLGSLQGEQVVMAPPTAWVPPPTAPVRGQVQLDVTDLGRWGHWLPAGWRLSGRLHSQAAMGGTFGGPEFSGTLEGSGLSVRNPIEGVNWTDARLRLVMRGDHAQLEQFSMQAGPGRIQATGGVRLGAEPSATLDLQADRFAVLQRVDRRLVVSGTARLTLDRQLTRLDGRLTADEGRFDFSRSDAPSLGDDVSVQRRNGRGTEDATGSDPGRPDRKLQLDVTAQLGDAFRLTGRGLNTRLVGEVRLTSPQNKLAVHGEIRAVDGTYAAYAQKLTVDRGIITFTGVAENPRLNILAIRPDLEDQIAGVSVTGTAQNPRIRLYSEPSLTDTETLSWLILGRAPDGLGRTDLALLQRAAFALLAGEDQSPSIIERLGIDQFSVSQSDSDTRETVVSVGKQISRRWYLGYERSLNAETGTWQLIYRLAKRFTVRAQSGAENALDVIWTWKWGTDRTEP